MKYHKKTILSPAELFFPILSKFTASEKKRKKKIGVSKELLKNFTYIPFDLNLDIEMIDRKKITKMSALRPLCTGMPACGFTCRVIRVPWFACSILESVD